MDSSEETYGWATDDPRWTDDLAGGKGRLEPSPAPRFGGGDVTAEPPQDAPSAAAEPLDLPLWPPAPPSTPGTPADATAGPLPASAAPWPPVPAGGGGAPADGPTATASRTAGPDEVPWIPQDTGPVGAGARPWAESSPASWEPTPRRPSAWESASAAAAPWAGPPESPPDPFGPPLAISAQPAHAAPPVGHGGAATSVPFTIHTQFPTPGLRTGYGLSSAALPAGAGAVAVPTRSARVGTRLERHVRLRTRRRADDEFRQAGRAELFSDDARYTVLLWLTAAWYAPVVVVYLGWAVIAGADQGATAAGVFAGVLWLGTAATLSLGVVSLLRWASVGWRAITLSLAAAVIGGGVVTIAHTLAA